MKAFQIAPLALAIGAMTFATVTNAEGNRRGHHGDGVIIKKHVHVGLEQHTYGDTYVGGYIGVDRLGMAIVDDKQSSTGNEVYNEAFSNTSDMGDGALKNASGNIGVNVAAGDNNVQGNSAALAATDAGFVFGGEGEGEGEYYSVGSSADAEIFVHQTTYYNWTDNYAQRNRASMGHGALAGASGNIGVNIASGNNNVQKNALAGSVGFGSISVATVNVQQHAHDNYTWNNALSETRETEVSISLSPSEEGGLYFNLPDATYAGTSDQYGDIYPDIWRGSSHPGGQNIGHMDLDDEVQGAMDLNGDGGALAFNEEGEITFGEMSEVALMGELSGSLTLETQVINERGWNRSTMGNNAMANASGNIGVNIASGTNNLQNNSLSIAALRGPDMGDIGGEGGYEPPMGGGSEGGDPWGY